MSSVEEDAPDTPTPTLVGRYVESTSPGVPFWQSTQGDTHGDACCYHNWDGKVPSFGNWLGDGVREIILEAYFKTTLRFQQIVQQPHGKNCCIEYYPERLSKMISNFISNVRRKQHGTSSKVTRVQLDSILSSFHRESSDDDTLIMLGHTYQTPKQMCMVFSILRWLRNARLQAIEAERCGPAVWLAIDGTGEAICEKNHILLMCTLMASHKVAISGITVAGSENDFSARYFCKTMRRKVQALFPGWKWLVQYVTSDGARAMGGVP